MGQKYFNAIIVTAILLFFGTTHSMKRKRESENTTTKKRIVKNRAIQAEQKTKSTPDKVAPLMSLCINKVTKHFRFALETSRAGNQRVAVCEEYWSTLKDIPHELQQEITETAFSLLSPKKVSPLFSKKFSLLLTLYEAIKSINNKNKRKNAKKIVIETCIKEWGRFGVRPLPVAPLLAQKNWVSDSFKTKILATLDNKKYTEVFTDIARHQTKESLSDFFRLAQKRKIIFPQNIIGWYSHLPIKSTLDVALETLNPQKIKIVLKQPNIQVRTTPFSESSFVRTICIAQKRNSILNAVEILNTLAKQLGKKITYSQYHKAYCIINKETSTKEIPNKKIFIQYFFQPQILTLWQKQFCLIVLNEAKDIFDKHTKKHHSNVW